jgi:hypothetical protein
MSALWRETFREGRLQPEQLSDLRAQHRYSPWCIEIPAWRGGHETEVPALEYLLAESSYIIALWIIEEFGIPHNTSASRLLRLHLRQKLAQGERKAEQWNSVMEALLDKTPSLPADSPDLLRLALEACPAEPPFLAQIIAKGVDPRIRHSDGRDAFDYLTAAMQEGKAWAAPALGRLQQCLEAPTTRRGTKRKACDHAHALPDVSGPDDTLCGGTEASGAPESPLPTQAPLR